jgi:hypothetical protein
MSPALVSPTSGWISSPSQISRAHLVMYSWARWIGFRVWNATTAASRARRRRPCLGRGATKIHERLGAVRIHAERDDLDGTRDAGVTLLHHLGHARVGVVLGAEDVGDLELLVVGVDLLHGDHALEDAVGAIQRAAVADLRGAGRVHGEQDGDRPDVAVGQRHVPADGFEVGLAHETREGAVATVPDQFEIAGLLGRQVDTGQVGGFSLQRLGLGAGDEAFGELAAVRLDQAVHGECSVVVRDTFDRPGRWTGGEYSGRVIPHQPRQK